MVSLGALNNVRHCAYSCLFCYVQAGFLAYPRLAIPEIIQWLEAQPQTEFDTIYVSGDTDSFAPPRTEQGLELLEALRSLQKDVLFTTRMVLDESDLERLATIVARYRENSLRVYGCVSIAQATLPHLEPHPIPSPEKRIAQLHAFRDAGLITMLAMRPFLPGVPTTDYEWILERALGGTDVVLGEVWYADMGGLLETKVLGGIRDHGYTIEKMPFDSNEEDWKVFPEEATRLFVENTCQRMRLPFFMHSGEAISWIRQRRML